MGAIWRRKLYWNKSHGCSSLQSSAQAFGEVGLGKAIGPQRTAKPLRVDAGLGSSKAKLITLTQPENFRFQLAACGKAKKFSDRKIVVRLARHSRRQAEHRNDLRLL